MSDTLSRRQRSLNMSKVRSADTKPEWILRCGLHRLGFRYRLANKHLPGKPDLAFPKYRAVVLVHGCYWHRHSGCKDASTPKSNIAFWTRKFAENVVRDRQAQQQLVAQGWRVMVVWECELTRQTIEAIEKVAAWLREASDACPSGRYDTPAMDRTRLMAVAEEKVRYRIASYGAKPEPDDSPSPEVDTP